MAEMKQDNAKKAIGAAQAYVKGIFRVQPTKVRLEELELDKTKNVWFITLSWLDPDEFFGGKREFKIFEINADDYSVEAIRVRTF